ncbi:MAG: ABC transporter substrate-binding protein [Treponema sp.]|nr:ABC transporter substrate-binding protein [Treponema sp.]
MKKRLYEIVAIGAMLLGTLCMTACVHSDNPVTRRHRATTRLLKKEHRIKIAVAAPWSQRRDHIMEGLVLARDEINESGGILGAEIELVPFDDGSNIDTGSRVAYEIASDEGICAVIGHATSSISVSNSLIYHYYGIPMFSPLSTSQTLTQQGLDMVFRNIPNEDEFAKKAVDFCRKMNWNRVVIYCLQTVYGMGMADAFGMESVENGITVIDRMSYEDVYDIYDYSNVAKRWRDNYSFDAVFIAGTLPQAAEIITVFRQNGITQPIIGGDTFDRPSFFSSGNNKSEDNVYVISNFDVNSEKEAFVKFKKAFTSLHLYDVDQGAYQAYDALKVLAKAIEKAGSVKGTDIAKTLHENELWDEVAGPYSFEEDGDITGHDLIVKKAGNGEFTRISY